MINEVLGRPSSTKTKTSAQIKQKAVTMALPLFEVSELGISSLVVLGILLLQLRSDLCFSLVCSVFLNLSTTILNT